MCTWRGEGSRQRVFGAWCAHKSSSAPMAAASMCGATATQHSAITHRVEARRVGNDAGCVYDPLIVNGSGVIAHAVGV